MPDSTDAYTHRIGRTGRIDQKGDALTFVTHEDAALIREIERILKASLERRTLEGFNYAAPAPEIPRERSSVPSRGTVQPGRYARSR